MCENYRRMLNKPALCLSFLLAWFSVARSETKITAETQKAYQQYALTESGNADRGRRLFLDEKRTKCVTCHQVNGQGGKVGPDLSRIGGKFDRPHLIESLLEPSQQIVEGYRTSVVLTKSGQALSGIVKNQTQRSFAIEDAAGKRTILARKDVEQVRESDVSLMPVALAANLTKDEFSDLIAYMESLRSDGNNKFGAGTRGPISLPDGFQVDTVATGLTGATAMEVTDDGRVLVCEQPGRLRLIANDRLLVEPILNVDVENYWERGLIGVTVHPKFPAIPFVYVCYVAKDPYTHHRVSRFRVQENVAIAGSEEVLLRGDDQSQLGGKVPAGHQGGAVHFGSDGKLYVGIGEQTAGIPAQRLDTFQGKILRLNDDGSIPSDNPFLTRTSGKYQAIWAIGCRNPFTFAIESHTGQILINDVGGKFEEINRGVAGANYGWPTIDHGFTDENGFVGPIHIYPQASINGGDFAPASTGEDYAGRYFFADFVHGWIKTIDPANPRIAATFATGIRRPVDLRFARDGSLYVLLRNAWVVDGKFETDTGSVLKIHRSFR